jgi:hypothetical protein
VVSQEGITLSGKASDHSAKAPDLHSQPPAHCRKGTMLSAQAALLLARAIVLSRKAIVQQNKAQVGGLKLSHFVCLYQGKRHSTIFVYTNAGQKLAGAFSLSAVL